MRLYSLRQDDGDFIGIEDDEGLLDLTRAIIFYELVMRRSIQEPICYIEELIEDESFGGSFFTKMMECVERYGMRDEFIVREECKRNAPIYPGKIIALGNNYHEHIKEMNQKIPEKPVLFGKWPSTVIGDGEAIVKPFWVSRMDYEAELAIIIGKTAKNVSARDAAGYIFGYTCFNDVTARDMQREDLSRSLPWMPSKNFDTFSPMGPCILLAGAVEEPVSIPVQCRVNGILKQNGVTSDFIFDIPTVIEYITSIMTLEPGDVISTGTPVGVGPLEPGDIVEVSCGGIGVLKNPVVTSEILHH